MKRIIKEAIGSFEATAYGGKGTTGGVQTALMSAGISLACLRGLAKIAIHYYLWTSRVHTGAELLFQPIRRFIQYGEGNWREMVILTGPQFIGQLAAGQVPECFSHFFMVHKQFGHIVSRVQFFAGPEHMTPPSIVLLGLTRRDVKRSCHWVSYYGEKIDGHDGEITEVTDARPLG
jgi:hypothetical protein